MRIAIIGGSFNPPHIGHMILIEEILATECYQRVLLIPAKAAPHKVPQMDPGPEMRLALLEASIEGWPNVAIEDCELRRAGLSYTSDTLEELWNRRLFDERPGLVIGDDLATDFLATWKRAEKILELADIIVAHRLYVDKIPLPYPHNYIENLIIPISSTLVRERIHAGGAWRSLVMPSVRTIIENYGLYRNT